MNNMTETEEDYFELKYLECVNDLFLSLKRIDNYYRLELFNGDFNELFEFIKRNVIVHEFSDNELSDSELSEY